MADGREADFMGERGRVVDGCAAFGDVEGKGGRVSALRERDIAALDHEGWDQAVEGGVVVGA